MLVFARMLPQSLCCTPLLKAPDEVPGKRLKTDVSFIVMNPLNTCSMTYAGALPTCPATAECWAEDAISAAKKQRVASDGSSLESSEPRSRNTPKSETLRGCVAI